MRNQVIRARGTPTKVTIETNIGPVTFGREADRNVYKTALEWKSIIWGLAIADPNEMLAIPMADYDNHFIFRVRDKRILGPEFMCSCGSSANVYGTGAYRRGSSLEGLRIHCLSLIETEHHGDGST